MNITILTSSQDHPVYPWLQKWQKMNLEEHNIDIELTPKGLPGGDFLFLISCSDIISEEIRAKYKYCLVVHASDLPKGRGWSPHVWQVIEGKNEIIVSLIEAQDPVDTGRIWHQTCISLNGCELYDKINDHLFESTLSLMEYAIENFTTIQPREQQEVEAGYYPKRTPEDSRIDISLPLEAQFDLLRVADPDRFPAFFEHRGQRYKIKIEKDE